MPFHSTRTEAHDDLNAKRVPFPQSRTHNSRAKLSLQNNVPFVCIFYRHSLVGLQLVRGEECKTSQRNTSMGGKYSKLSCNTPQRRITTVSLETYPLYSHAKSSYVPDFLPGIL